ncbi:MAG TPA: zinc ribbon domain-containing protein [Candidatus Paceibacterota bacterium]|nr:zinc ribbon domain-containing protein [Candidatus Paceibacterota bacterium]
MSKLKNQNDIKYSTVVLMVKCPKCEKEAGTFYFCKNCGTLLREECPSCKQWVDVNMQSCPKCGRPNRLYPS